MTPHGIPHNPSCKTDASCPNHRTDLMTCREAAIRYRGDYAYMKLVDAGTPPLTREVFAEPVKVAKPVRVPRARHESKPRPTSGVIGPDGLVHGTLYGHKRGCATDCPAPSMGLPTCTEAAHTSWRVSNKKLREKKPRKARRVARHGTVGGYQQFKCRSRTDCPAIAEGGVSCGQAKSDYWKSRNALAA